MLDIALVGQIMFMVKVRLRMLWKLSWNMFAKWIVDLSYCKVWRCGHWVNILMINWLFLMMWIIVFWIIVRTRTMNFWMMNVWMMYFGRMINWWGF